MGKAKHYEKHILCLEGDWNENLKVKSSILPALELLQLNSDIDSIYKTCATKTEFFNRIDQILSNKTKYGKYQIIYLAFHGYKGGIYLNEEEEISLQEFANKYENCLEGKIIHFGSCSTLKTHEDEIYNFLEKTNALAVSGYEKDIDFISSTVFDVLYFELSQQYISINALEDKMINLYGELCNQLKFKIYH